MILSTHAVAGAAAALLFKTNPLLAFFAAFASHFVLDAIPHWEYRVASVRKHPITKKTVFKGGTPFLEDLIKTGADAGIGMLLAFVFAGPQTQYMAWIVLLGVVGGLLPDLLQLVYAALWRGKPLASLQRFHMRIHSSNKTLYKKPLLGIGLQLLTIAFFAIVIQYLT